MHSKSSLGYVHDSKFKLNLSDVKIVTASIVITVSVDTYVQNEVIAITLLSQLCQLLNLYKELTEYTNYVICA